jgi:hypothetical protein
MSEVRPYRLLNAVENGTVLGAELNTYLTDAGRLAEWTVLYAQRGQAKRIANGATTMAAIVSSVIATDAAFLQATPTNDTIVSAVVLSAIAMSATADVISVLITVADNPTSWGYFTGSSHYESHIKKIVAHLSGIDPSVYPSMSALLLDPVSMGDISVSERGMRALVNSLPSVTTLAGDSTAMGLVAANSVAIELVAKQTSIMPTIADNVPAMNAIVSRSVATGLMAANPGAIQAIGANAIAWANYQGGAYFSTYLKTVIANLAGVVPSDYASISEIFADSAASLAVANSQPAMQAIISDSGAVASMVGSPHLAAILGANTAMSELAASESTMDALIVNPTAFPLLFESTLAKAAIFASSTLVATMLGNAGALGTVSASAVSKTMQNQVVIGSYVSMGIPGNIIILTGVLGSIVATATNGWIRSSGDAHDANGYFAFTGTSATSGPIPVNKAYTNAEWDLNAIAATAAAALTISYVDFN